MIDCDRKNDKKISVYLYQQFGITATIIGGAIRRPLELTRGKKIPNKECRKKYSAQQQDFSSQARKIGERISQGKIPVSHTFAHDDEKKAVVLQRGGSTWLN